MQHKEKDERILHPARVVQRKGQQHQVHDAGQHRDGEHAPRALTPESALARCNAQAVRRQSDRHLVKGQRAVDYVQHRASHERQREKRHHRHPAQFRQPLTFNARTETESSSPRTVLPSVSLLAALVILTLQFQHPNTACVLRAVQLLQLLQFGHAHDGCQGVASLVVDGDHELANGFQAQLLGPATVHPPFG